MQAPATGLGGSSGIPALKTGWPSRGKVPLGQSSQVLVGKLNCACGPCVEAPTCVCVRERGEGWVHPSPYLHRGQGLCLPGRVVDASSDPNPALPSMAWLCQGRCWQQRARGAFARMVSVFSRIAVAESRGALEIH